jgi:uncharacterized integral membrane protein
MLSMMRALIFAPLLFLLVLFALSNPQPVHLGMWPTDYGADLPLSIALLIGSAAAFVLGALLMWLALVGARLRARRSEQQVKIMEKQVANLQTRLAEAEAKAAPAPVITGTAVTTTP